MKERLWYPQLDVYDGIRRMGAILASMVIHLVSSVSILPTSFWQIHRSSIGVK